VFAAMYRANEKRRLVASRQRTLFIHNS